MMEKKRDKDNRIKKVAIADKSKVIYCLPTNRRIEYVRHNSKYIKLSDYRKQVGKKTRKSRGGAYSEDYIKEENTVEIEGKKYIRDKDIPKKEGENPEDAALKDAISKEKILYEHAIFVSGHIYDIHCIHKWVIENHKKTDPLTRGQIKDEDVERISQKYDSLHGDKVILYDDNNNELSLGEYSPYEERYELKIKTLQDTEPLLWTLHKDNGTFFFTTDALQNDYDKKRYKYLDLSGKSSVNLDLSGKSSVNLDLSGKSSVSRRFMLSNVKIRFKLDNDKYIPIIPKKKNISRQKNLPKIIMKRYIPPT